MPKPPFEASSWVFIGDGGLAQFPDTDAFIHPDPEFKADRLVAPRENPDWQPSSTKRESFGANNVSLQYAKGSCALLNRLPDCGFGDGKSNYDVFYATEIDSNVQPSKMTYIPCPDPKEMNGCPAMFKEKSAALRLEVLNYIQS